MGRQYDVPGDFIEPLQLQVVCEALWRRLPNQVHRVSWREVDQAMHSDSEGDSIVRPRERVTKFVESVLKDFCGKAMERVVLQYGFYPLELVKLGCQQFISSRGTRLYVHQDPEYTGILPNRIVELLAQQHLLRVEERNGERSYELAHDTLIEPIQAMAENVDTVCLQDLCSRVFRRIADSERARSENIDLDTVVLGCCFDFVDGGGKPLRVSLHSLQHGLARLPLWTVDMLAENGVVRQVSEGFELAHSRMASEGVIGALVWGMSIAGFLLPWWFISEEARPWRARYPRLNSAAVGAGGGIVGGILISITLLYAQRPESLFKAGWIVTAQSPRWTAFTVTGLGYSMLLFGLAVGLSSGLTAIRILLSTRWETFVARNPKPTHLAPTARILGAILYRVALFESWSILVPMIAAAIVVYEVLSFLYKPPSILRVAGECLSITFGCIGLVSGLLSGLYILGKGIGWSDRESFALLRIDT
jgi:hypothetical protein